MYSNLDYRLNSLILKHKIYGDYKKFTYKMNTIKIINDNLDFNKKILIVSDNLTDIQMFFSTLYIREDNHIQGCLYKESLPHLDEYHQIWNVDLEWDNEKYAGLKQLPQGTVLNLYQFLSNNGLSINWNFYNIFEDCFIKDYGETTNNYRHIDWYGLYYGDKGKYNKEKTRLNLENLIFICLELKDFEQAFSYMELSNELKFKEFKKELEELLHELKEKTTKRKKDIIINWIDALDYGSIDKEHMPYLYECQNKSQCFSNAYASTPYTGAALMALFAHITMLDDEGYKRKKISSDNSRLIRCCEENGYVFRYYGMHYKSFVKQHVSTIQHYRTATTGQINWDVLCDLYEMNSPMVIVAHNMAETHPPFRSCFAEEYYVNKESLSYRNVDLKECKKRGKKYIDKMLQWYNAFLKNEDIMIYLSDHGDPSTLITGIWRPHVNLFITKNGLQPYVEDGNYSMINFDILLMDMINNKFISIRDYTVEVAEIQDCDLYNKYRVDAILSPDKFDYEVSIGYRSIVTEDALYMIRNDGIEAYYNKFSCINTVTYKCNAEKIIELREYIIKRNKDCKFNGRFPWSEKLYRARRRYMERNGDVELGTLLLIEKLNTISKDKIIAIRGGGTHTIELLNAIGNIGERISYIIDKDISNAFIFKEFEVILPEQVDVIEIDILIISSLRYREEFKQEALKYEHKMEIIDVYEMLENKGILTNKGFYEPNYLECDFEK